MVFIKKNKNNVANAMGVMNCASCKHWAANRNGFVDEKNKSYCSMKDTKTSAKKLCMDFESDI